MPEKTETEPLVKISKHATQRGMSTTQFMAKVMRCISTLKDGDHRRETRATFAQLLRNINAGPTNDPPYDSVAAEKLQTWLSELQNQTDFDFAIDFLSVLDTVDRLAEEHKQQEAEKAARRASYTKKNDTEWNIGIISEEEAEEEWTLL